MKTDKEIEEAVKVSSSYAQVLKRLGIKIAGGNYKILKRRIQEAGFDISHFTGKGHLKGKTHNWATRTPLSEILKEGTHYQSYGLKKRLLREGKIENKCVDCGLTDTYNGKPLSLHLDHVNGDNTDNRIENLRMLCPNCHSQTDTYAGKNKGR